MTDEYTFITREGLARLKKELQYLKTEKRKEIAERIKEAKELGDLSENAEYTEAKEEQGFTASKIAEIEHIVKRAQVIEETKKVTDKVVVGCSIMVKNNGGEESEYTIVGSNEADPANGKISNESPFGRAFLGKKIGEKATVKTPKGELEFEIVKIS